MTETKSNRIAATYSLTYHPAINLSLFLVLIGLLIRARTHPWIADDPMILALFRVLPIIFAVIALGELIKLIHPVYFTADGLEFHRLNKVLATLPWEHISDVGIGPPPGSLKHYRTRSYLQFHTVYYPAFRIICPWITKLIQTIFFDIVRIDPTKKNIDAVRQFYGELDYKPKAM